MALSTFPTFLTFLTQTLCFSAPASDPWQGLENPVLPSPRAPWAADRRAGRRRLDRPARVCVRVHHGTPLAPPGSAQPCLR
jgi:hypothetical protein